ncbi:MAG: 5'-methylthioadenosine/adenosylhomocysteine nucleosidase [Atopobiaceae bacterium]|nr:5'-methylthioadenosine/adenosylhomocysteine nucleosidase [Atopobiaceae bacterium]
MKVGIIAAMEEEAAHLKERMDIHATKAFLGREFYEGVLGGKDVVLVVCGVGKVNAAACAQVLADRFAITHLVFTGVAGSLHAAIDICDVVVSTDCVQHDFDVAGLGFAPGIIPYQDESFFEADEGMRAAVVRAVHEVAPEIKVFEGRIASGDQFVSGVAAKDRIVSSFGALCCEMEGAAVAHVAWLNSVPFVVIRAISDKADGSADMDYVVFKEQAANRSAAIAERLMTLL